MEYVKDRTEGCFDDYYPCMNKKVFDCSILHILKVDDVIIFMYNTVTMSISNIVRLTIG